MHAYMRSDVGAARCASSHPAYSVSSRVDDQDAVKFYRQLLRRPDAI